VSLAPGEHIYAESGELSWLSSTIHMRTGMTVTGASGGFFDALKRVFGGGTLFMTEYEAQGAPGFVAFASKVPGSILPCEVGPGRSYMVHRHGFLCGTPGATLSVGFQRSLGAGIFGGEGFVLQKIDGHGLAFIELSGEVVTYDIPPGEILRVHPGHVGMFQEGVGFDITTVPGITNKLFGGDGLFLAALRGPGRVWLQSLPLPNLAHALVPYLPRPPASGGG
jgi:uncharacterized protein (AIM24 family)